MFPAIALGVFVVLVIVFDRCPRVADRVADFFHLKGDE